MYVWSSTYCTVTHGNTLDSLHVIRLLFGDLYILPMLKQDSRSKRFLIGNLSSYFRVPTKWVIIVMEKWFIFGRILDMKDLFRSTLFGPWKGVFSVHFRYSIKILLYTIVGFKGLNEGEKTRALWWVKGVCYENNDKSDKSQKQCWLDVASMTFSF